MRNVVNGLILFVLLLSTHRALAAPPSLDGTKLPSAATQIFDGQQKTWTLSGGIAYRQGAATPSNSVILLLYYGGAVFQENVNSAWWRWGGSGAWIATTDPRVVSASSTTIPSSASIVDGQLNVWMLYTGVAYQNGQATASGSDIQMVYANGVVYLQNSAHNWFQRSGSSWVSATAPVVASSNGTTAPAASSVVDSALNKWTIVSGQAFKNGVATASSGVVLLLYYGGVVYQESSSGNWSKWSGGAWAATATDPRVPALAAAAGFNVLNFNSTAVGTTGGTWQRSTLNGIPGTTNCSLPVQNGDGSFTVGGNGAPCSVVTAIKGSGANGWTGVTFKPGMYVKAIVSFTGSNPGAGGSEGYWPSFWAQAIWHADGATANNAPVDQWPGQASGYEHYLEADFWEAFCGTASTAEGVCQPISVNNTGSNTGKTTFIDWYGVFADGYSKKPSPAGAWQLPNDQTWATPHTLEIVWSPGTGTGSAKGYVKSYIDGVSLPSTVDSWYPYSASLPPPPYLGSSAFAIGDVMDFTLVAGTGISTPLTVHSIEVWQASAAGKKVQ